MGTIRGCDHHCAVHLAGALLNEETIDRTVLERLLGPREVDLDALHRGPNVEPVAGPVGEPITRPVVAKPVSIRLRA
jgi:hypothetical protein